MNEVLEKLNYSPNPSFKDVFNKDLCQKIAKLYWNDYFSDNKFLFSTNDNPQEILQRVLVRFPKMKNATAFKLVGLYMLCKDDEGMRGLRQIIDRRRIAKTDWNFIKKELKKFEDEIFANPSWRFIKNIEKELNEFKAFRLNN